MSKLPDSSNREKWLQIYLACKQNAEQFCSDSKLLADHSSFGHATSLAVLGLEEVTKAILGYFHYLGIELPGWLIKQFRKGHTARLFFVQIYNLAYQLRDQIPDMEKQNLLKETLLKTILTGKSAEEFFNEMLHGLVGKISFPDSMFSNTGKKAINENTLKKKGFYVDWRIKKKNYKIFTPLNMEKADWQHQYDDLSTILKQMTELETRMNEYPPELNNLIIDQMKKAFGGQHQIVVNQEELLQTANRVGWIPPNLRKKIKRELKEHKNENKSD